ncbi:TonB-dependent receptor [Arcicella lustrica]|uniref:TonB-dependent receptor n=1 Tax=Arcicella lustrica TaxID=2984196 RepID=A0ABU5SPF7_9BACT|nr:TonB-dependent receptor [Arcicella sp. DC25W]MEA5429181.1 TonB-dependent receptor [Arcicella sp. DC25W]
MKKNLKIYNFIWQTMKLTFYQLCLITVFMNLSFATSLKGQDVLSQTITLKVNNQRVKEVLRIIEKNSNIHFVYSSRLIDSEQKITVNLSNSTVKEVLDKVLTPIKLKYEVSGRQIVLDNAISMLRLSELKEVTVASIFQVSGKVTDESGVGIPGVNVVVKGTNTGTTTDGEGNYKLSVSDKDVTLVFSFVGYKSIEKNVGNQSVINVQLSVENNALDEVVVIGYGTAKKRDLTGSVVSIREADITATPVNNVMEALQGKIAGADINRLSGAVGTDADVLLRGNRSVYGDNSPLYIVDGIQASYSQINPSDIATIDVLKDASSTAIYGSAGANGVIIITTKRGKEGKTSIDFDSFYGVSGKPHYTHSMIGEEYANYRRELYRTTNGAYPDDMSQIFTNVNILNAYNEGQWIDWTDELVNNSATQEKYNLSFTTAGPKTKVYTSFLYTREGGLLPRENQSRGGVRLNLDHTFSTWAKVGTNLNLNYTVRNARNNNIFTKSLPAFPLGKPRDEFGNINAEFIDGELTPLGDEIPNQYADNTRSTYGVLNSYLELTPVKGLIFRSNIGLTLNSSRQGRYIGKQSSALPPSGYTLPLATLNDSNGYGYIWENTATYNKTFLDDHNFTITGITSWADSRSENNNSLGQGQDLDSYLFYNIGNGTQKFGIGSSYQKKTRLSFAGRVNYSYRGKYLLTFTNRWDGVSHLAKGHKWSNFPAVAGAWRISDEGFMAGTKRVINDLKLRAGYGVTGNSGGMDAYSSQTQAITYQAVSLNGALVSHVQNVGTFSNPEISWERSYNLNLGLDLSLFKNRIDLSLDFYNTDTKGLLFRRTLPITAAITAWGSPLQTWQNIGVTNNKGFEISLRTINISNSKFKWISNFSFTRNQEKIVDLPDGDVIAERLFEGYPVRALYDFKYLGIWSTEEQEEAAKYGAKPGYVKVATNERIVNGVSDGGVHTYADSDRMILGTTAPKWLLGLNNSFNYKGFDLGTFVMVRWGQTIQSKLLGWYRGNDEGQPAGIDYWTPENQGAYFPRPGVGSTTGIASLTYVDGSFVKLKTVTLGYTLPEKARKLALMNKARVYATVYNPLVFTKEKSIRDTDPETNGSDTFPLFATFVLGLNVSF